MSYYPDGGYGWIIVFASFVISFITDGVLYTFSIFHVSFLNEFNESKYLTSWISSLLNGCLSIIGPVSSYLTARYGCRTVAITGCIMAASGFVVSSMAQNVSTLILTTGIIAGNYKY